MSMYNLLHGVNPLATVLEAILGLDFNDRDPGGMPEWEDCYDEEALADYVRRSVEARYWPTGRFRDIWVEPDGKTICLYTRNGGGNREWMQHVFDILRQHPYYQSDEDDDFDETYASIYFRVPDEYAKFAAVAVDSKRSASLWEKTMGALKDLWSVSQEEAKSDKRFAPLLDIVQKITKDDE